MPASITCDPGLYKLRFVPAFPDRMQAVEMCRSLFDAPANLWDRMQAKAGNAGGYPCTHPSLEGSGFPIDCDVLQVRCPWLSFASFSSSIWSFRSATATHLSTSLPSC